MKALAICLAVLVCGLSLLCIVQKRQLWSQSRQIADLREDLERRSKESEELQKNQAAVGPPEEKAPVSNEQLKPGNAATNSITATLAQPDPPTNAQAEKGQESGLGSFLGKLMQDPDTKKLIQQQQRMMFDQMYGPLIKQLGLSPEDGAKLKDLIGDASMKSVEAASSMFGDSGATNRTEVASAMAAHQQELDDQIKAFLGDDRFKAYKDYQQTVGERMQLNLFRQQYTGDYPLNDIQADQILALMKDEKARAGDTGLSAPGQGGNLESMLSEQQMDKLLASQQSINDRVFERARTILSPDQLQSFGGFQSNQLQMMRVGMGMARRMFSAPQNPPGN